jgi:hypothetical protein
MKLVNRKTRKAIEKSVRKAMKKHGPALVAALAGGIASSIATLAKTEAPDKHGKSNLANLVDGATASVQGDSVDRSRPGLREKKRKRRTSHGTDRPQPPATEGPGVVSAAESTA